MRDEELRIAGCCAFNRYAAETWAEYADRATPIGVIPMYTPQEAIAELEHCQSLGIKAVAMGSLIRRPIPAAEKQGVSRRYAFWVDVLGLDSNYDYDPGLISSTITSGTSVKRAMRCVRPFSLVVSLVVSHACALRFL